MIYPATYLWASWLLEAVAATLVLEVEVAVSGKVWFNGLQVGNDSCLWDVDAYMITS